MVLTQAQTTTFFQDAAQMGLPNRTVTQLATEGITDVTDLADFKKEHLELVAKNLRALPGRVSHPDAALAAAGTTIPTPPFVIAQNP
jgi:predicted RecB family nuclease